MVKIEFIHQGNREKAMSVLEKPKNPLVYEIEKNG